MLELLAQDILYAQAVLEVEFVALPLLQLPQILPIRLLLHQLPQRFNALQVLHFLHRFVFYLLVSLPLPLRQNLLPNLIRHFSPHLFLRNQQVSLIILDEGVDFLMLQPDIFQLPIKIIIKLHHLFLHFDLGDLLGEDLVVAADDFLVQGEVFPKSIIIFPELVDILSDLIF